MQYKNRGSDDLIDQLKDVLVVARTIETTTDRTLDLTHLRWVPPLEILALAALKQQANLTFTYPKNATCQTYLEHIGFPKGKTEIAAPGNNYIPILKFKTGTEGALGRGGLEKQIIHLFTNYVGAKEGVLNGIAYSISEMFDNIEEHAKVEEAFIHAMYYPGKKFLDICIVDSGVTIPGSYKKHGIEFSSDVEALEMALQGVSTKDDGRGTGLRSMVAVVGKSFDGDAVIVSGKAFATVTTGSNVEIAELPVEWKGTMIVMRIPKQKSAVEDIYKDFDLR